MQAVSPTRTLHCRVCRIKKNMQIPSDEGIWQVIFSPTDPHSQLLELVTDGYGFDATG
jgi:hypothetical protein